MLKDTNEQPDEEIHSVRARRILSTGASVPVKPGLPPSRLTESFFIHSEVLQTPSVRVCMETLLHKRDYLRGDYISLHCLSSPQRSEGGVKVTVL